MTHIVESIEKGDSEMYHDYCGREIEDLEGESMRRDAHRVKIKSHQQTVQLITGREITRTVFDIEGTALYQQGTIRLDGQQVPVYRADDEGPIWHEDIEK